MAQQLLDPRELTLEGSVNFRDLGGMETTTGGTIKPRHIFRSDALHRLTSTDLAQLADYGISMLVDLRGEQEIERSGPSPLLESGTRHFHAPLMTTAAPTSRPDPSLGMEVMYGQMLENARPKFGEIFQTLAEESNLPAVIHCTAGKDRTGVTVALLLRLLEVPDETIVLDYALTDRNMQRLMERWTTEGAAITTGQYPAHYMRANPETMERFLQALDVTFGSANDYLLEAGLSADQAVAIRTRLVNAA